jgi:hypothetical protein
MGSASGRALLGTCQVAGQVAASAALIGGNRGRRGKQGREERDGGVG